MRSIESRAFPLVFPVPDPRSLGFLAPALPAGAIRTQARALEGMQKEAVVCVGRGVAWRMVSDEGPYLNGTDLAPFPLAFFTAGMAANYLSSIVAALTHAGVAWRGVRFTQDNRYTMAGSALKGTMTGGALPVELTLQVDAAAPAATIQSATAAAVESAPVTALMRAELQSAFALTVNGREIPTGRVRALSHAIDAPAPVFDAAAPPTAEHFTTDLIEKRESARTLVGVDGGAGTSLSAEQNRTLHVRGECSLRTDGLIEVQTQLLKPIGSVFRFLATRATGTDADDRRAPSGLAYLSAGIAFCYLTQLGRYAHIVKRPLAGYRVAQDTRFFAADGAVCVAPVGTHVSLDVSEDDDYARTLVDMGEQTCFLHAACRASVPTTVAFSP